MENASKALIMAGSILIALLTIGALVFMFDSITGVEQQKNQNAEIDAVLEFNRQFEAFDTVGLRGTDILTIVNKMVNYNESNDVVTQGYEPMSMEVTFVSGQEEPFNTNRDLEDVYSWYDNSIEDSEKMTLLGMDEDEQKEFKRKYFKCTDVQYDNNTGRVISMGFKEIEIN